MQRSLNDSMKPIIIEFAGLPGAGKTTTIELLDHYFRREKMSVRIVTEGAQACPISQDRRIEFMAWTAHRLMNVLLEEAYASRGYDLILIDRGLFDVQAFAELLVLESKVSPQEGRILVDYMRLGFWASLTDQVFFLDISPQVSWSRHRANTLTQKDGPIMNEYTLNLLASCYETVLNFHETCIPRNPIQRFDAETSDDPKQLATRCVSMIKTIVATRSSRSSR